MDKESIEKYKVKLKEVCEFQRAYELFDDDMSKMLSLSMLDKMAAIQDIMEAIQKQLSEPAAIPIGLDNMKIAEPVKEIGPVNERDRAKETERVIKKIIKKPQPSKKKRGKTIHKKGDSK